MKATLVESHSLEQPAAGGPARCPACRRGQALKASLAAACLVHAGLLGVLHLGGSATGLAAVDPLGLGVFYLVAVSYGLGLATLHPAHNPWPLRTSAALLGVAGGLLPLALLTLPEPGACIPEPGVPAVAYPALVVGLAAFLLAGTFLGERLRRDLAASAAPPGWVLGALRFAAPGLLASAVVAGLAWGDGRPAPGPWVLGPGLLAGLLAGLAASLAAEREPGLPALPEAADPRGP